MSRIAAIPLLIAGVVVAISLLVAGMVSPGGDDKARTPLGDVRVQKILDFQLPEV